DWARKHDGVQLFVAARLRRIDRRPLLLVRVCSPKGPTPDDVPDRAPAVGRGEPRPGVRAGGRWRSDGRSPCFSVVTRDRERELGSITCTATIADADE